MKSNYEHEAYALLVNAVSSAFSELGLHEREFLKDFKTLEKNFASGFWTLVRDLAGIDKFLLATFATGSLPTKRPPLTKAKSKDDMRPVFLSELWAGIVEPSGLLMPTEALVIANVRYLRQICCLLKKLTKEFTDDQLNQSCANFVRTDSEVANHVFESGIQAHIDSSQLAFLHAGFGNGEDNLHLATRFLSLFDRVAGMSVASLGAFDPYGIKPRHGPGVVADGRRESYKYDFPTWPQRLEEFFPSDWHASHNFTPKGENREVPSRLIAVPKDYKGPRLIAAEPTCMMWIQQGILGWLEEGINRSPYFSKAINLRDQTLSQKKACEGSRDGSLATLDLSEASDRIAHRLVERMFKVNPHLVECINSCRSQYIELMSGDFRRLNKFSTMGSALTFPVQTVLFSIISVVGMLVSEDVLEPTPRKVRDSFARIRVFGDDIIVPNDAANSVILVLQALGLKVNTDKSFWTGRFRESCGGDYLDGHDVTPIKIKSIIDESNTESIVSWVEAHNNVLLRGFITLAQDMMAMLPQQLRDGIARKHPLSGMFGLISLDVPVKEHPTRVGPTQVCEVLVLTPLQRSKRIETNTDAPAYQYFLENPDPMLKWGSGPRSRPSLQLKRRWVPLADY